MAANLTVVCMLVLLGLAYSPSLAEALKCYQCSGDLHECTGSNEAEVICSAGHICEIAKAFGKTAKSCEPKNGDEHEKFQCVQRELGQRGNCIRASALDFTIAARKCGVEISLASEGKWNLEWEMLSFIQSGWNNTESHEVIQPKQGGSFAACICTTDLCNTQAFLDNGNEGGSGTTGRPVSTTKSGGNGSRATGRLKGAGMALASGIFAVMISWVNV